MDYKKIYDRIIENRKQNPLKDGEYGERHHILPKSLGGDDSEENLVKLTAREHFIVHALLAEMYEKESFEWYKMNHAFMMMKATTDNQYRYINNRLYEYKRLDFSKVMKKSQSGKKNSQYGKVWVYNNKLKKSIKISKNELLTFEKESWNLGRKINWGVFNKCIECNKKFIPVGNEKFCSNECRNIHRKRLRTPASVISKIEHIAANYEIIYGKLTENKEFIIDCMDAKCSKNQICLFLNVNNSGGNYKTINNLYASVAQRI